MIKITSFREDENRIDFMVDGQPYHTNPEGYGLWVGEDYLRQIEGTAQFSLRQKTKNGVYKALKKRYEEEK